MNMTVTRAMLGVLCWAWLGMDSLWAVGPCVETFRDLQWEVICFRSGQWGHGKQSLFGGSLNVLTITN